jgi:hypothetical protein
MRSEDVVRSSDRSQTRSQTASSSPMSVTAFFDYLHEHDATTALAQAIGQVVMLRTCGARRDASRTNQQRLTG